MISILHGSPPRAAPTMPGLSDYVIAVKGNGAPSSPGRRCSRPPPGRSPPRRVGRRQMHASVSGLAEYLAENDGQAVQMCRELLHRLQWNKDCAAPSRRSYREPSTTPTNWRA